MDELTVRCRARHVARSQSESAMHVTEGCVAAPPRSGWILLALESETENLVHRVIDLRLTALRHWHDIS